VRSFPAKMLSKPASTK